MKFTIDDVKNYIEQNSKSKLLSTEYKNDATNLLFLCHCNKEFKTTFNSFKFKYKRQCNSCSTKDTRLKVRIPFNEIKKYIEVLSNTNSKLITSGNEYISTKVPLIIQCGCGNIYKRNFENFKKGTGLCLKCIKNNAAQKYKFSYEYVKNFIEVESKSGCKLVSEEYINTTSKLEFICNCSKSFETTFVTFVNLNKRHCDDCGLIKHKKNRSKNPENFKIEFKNIVGNEYDLLTEYNHSDEKILVRHNSKECNFHEYYVTPSKFLYGRRCPSCYQSNGEKSIRMWMDQNKINYKSQFKFPDCKKIRPLPFDFAVFDENNELQFLIEYQGEQHYRPVEIFGGSESYKKTKENDAKKKKYCLENNISLIEIPYHDLKNIPAILENVFMEVNDESVRCS